ncbi:hypothetical protein MIND_00995200 [Mycena indigotica]|uniref:AB hydrolase-1 domain-containing protein n=1 Tax=Mycena indigotica TaxID=2126181 RepID=A0A8H6VUN7_9AGAR|nr:uncharacterized protein MIND_00995200 [Mycena indigotica]KAF7294587.1 hypothetical protein MIND_00995200 [Mycena indigotica]
MIGQSLPEYWFILVSISGLRLVAPASIALITAYAVGFISAPQWLVAYAACETVFLGVYTYRRWEFNKPPPPIPPRLTRAQRRALFEKCASHLTTDYPTGWFLPHDAILKRDNVQDWILWALFASTPQEASPEWIDEINEYISVVEETLGRKLEHGRDFGAESLRLSFDPVKMVHRPLIWYLTVALVDMTTSIFLISLGFKHYAPRAYFSAFPPRLFTSLFSRRAANEHFPYWYRPPRGDAPSKPTLLFLHGIGIGLHPYVPLFRELLRSDPTQSILLMEFLPVSMRMTPPMPSCRITLESINAVLEDLSVDQVTLAAHSYGTFISAYIIRASSPSTIPEDELDPALILNEKVVKIVLVDPIPFLLHLPSVAYNFLYRPPGKNRANEWQLWYFASRDADVARVLSRGFFWEEGCLWREDLDHFSARGRRKVTVVLAGKDQIVPAAQVREYLTCAEPGEWFVHAGGGCERWVAKSGLLEVVWFPRLDHATVFEKKERRKMLIRAVGSAEEPVSYGATN